MRANPSKQGAGSSTLPSGPNRNEIVMEKTKYYIGIDPGVHTGLAIWDADGREFVRVDRNAQLVEFGQDDAVAVGAALLDRPQPCRDVWRQQDPLR